MRSSQLMGNSPTENRLKRSLNIALLGCVLLALLAGAPVAAQSPAQKAPTGQASPKTPPLRVTSRLVQVNVIVQDKNGQPVPGLTKDDFALFDQGQSQQIASFSEQTNHLTTTGAAAAANLFTNRSTQSASAQPPLTVIVLDAFNARYWDLHSNLCPPPPSIPPKPQVCAVGPMFEAVEKFISQMQPQDRVALYELSDTLYLLQDFTSDPSALQRGLDHGREYVPDSIPPSQFDPVDMDAYTMDAMHAIADHLANVPGRKNLIWISSGFPPVRIVTAEKIDKTAKTLANADLPLSAIDALGLYGDVNAGGPVPGGGGGGGHSGGHAELAPPPGAVSSGVAMAGRTPQVTDFDLTKNLAEMSGGRAFENTNDFAGAIRRVIDDSSATYLLSYYPDHNKWRGEFREIKVKVNRPGVEVRSRRGYYAVADTASAPKKDAEQLAEAIQSSLEATDLGFDVQADAVDVPGARQLKVKIILDPSQLRFQQRGGRLTDSITKVWAEFNADGYQVGTISQNVSLNATQDEYKQLLQTGFSISETVALVNGATDIRLVLQDVGNGAIGSVNIPLMKLFTPNKALR